MKEPFGRNEALKRIQKICREGSVSFSNHAKLELAKDRLATVDAINIMRCGKITGEAELVKGTYRYRVHTPKMCVVVAFRSESEISIVTAWRK